MQDWTAFERHIWARKVVFDQFCQVLGLAREKAPVNEEIKIPGQNSNVSVFKTKARTALHA
jgi:hypothetical protein